MAKFKEGDVVEDNGGCGYYLAGTINKVKGQQVYLKGRDSWVNQSNLKLLNLVGRDVEVSIKGILYKVRILGKA